VKTRGSSQSVVGSEREDRSPEPTVVGLRGGSRTLEKTSGTTGKRSRQGQETHSTTPRDSEPNAISEFRNYRITFYRAFLNDGLYSEDQGFNANVYAYYIKTNVVSTFLT